MPGLPVIFTTQYATRTVGTGTFHCPSCRTRHVGYEQKRVRRYLAVSFVLVVPLEVRSEYILCGSCGAAHEPGILSYDPEAELRHLEEVRRAMTIRVLARVTAADGRLATLEVEAVRTKCRDLMAYEAAAGELEGECAAAMGSVGVIDDDVKGMIGGLGGRDRELLMNAACVVALADGEPNDPERRLLVELAKALAITPLHFQAIMRHAEEVRA